VITTDREDHDLSAVRARSDPLIVSAKTDREESVLEVKVAATEMKGLENIGTVAPGDTRVARAWLRITRLRHVLSEVGKVDTTKVEAANAMGAVLITAELKLHQRASAKK
jgi:hypothetical protein